MKYADETDYEFSGKLVDPLNMKQGKGYYLRETTKHDYYFITFIGVGDLYGSPVKFKTLPEAMKRHRVKKVEDLPQYYIDEGYNISLRFESDDNGISLYYLDGKWGYSSTTTVNIYEADLSKEGKWKTNKHKIGKFKDFLDI